MCTVQHLTMVTVDCLRGTYEIDAVKVVHDFGSSMNRAVDLGQCEGGIVQGIGWMTMEEVIYNEEENYYPMHYQLIKYLTFILFQKHSI